MKNTEKINIYTYNIDIMCDLMPKMLVKKPTKKQISVVKIDKENLEENIVFDNQDKQTIITTDEKEIIITPEEEQEIKQLEEEIKELEKPEPEPIIQPEPEPEPIPIIQPVKVDKRKGKISDARREHLAVIREKALIARRKKAEERKIAKEQKEQQIEQPQPIYNHSISAIEIQNAVSQALTISEEKRLERKNIKKKKKEEELQLSKENIELEMKKKRIYNAINIPESNPWEFCFK